MLSQAVPRLAVRVSARAAPIQHFAKVPSQPISLSCSRFTTLMRHLSPGSLPPTPHHDPSSPHAPPFSRQQSCQHPRSHGTPISTATPPSSPKHQQIQQPRTVYTRVATHSSIRDCSTLSTTLPFVEVTKVSPSAGKYGSTAVDLTCFSLSRSMLSLSFPRSDRLAKLGWDIA